MDYESFSEEIHSGVIDEMGSSCTVLVPDASSVSTTGKKKVTYSEYTGTAVRGSYDSDFITSDSVVKAGDLKFICYFDDDTFEPSDKKNEQIVFGDNKYTIIHVKTVAPSEDTVIVYVIQARRVN